MTSTGLHEHQLRTDTQISKLLSRGMRLAHTDGQRASIYSNAEMLMKLIAEERKAAETEQFAHLGQPCMPDADQI